MARGFLIVLAVALCSCRQYPEYPPPAQFQPGAPNPELIVDFGQEEAATHIVKDIDPFVHGNWVLTKQEPTLKILAISNQNMKLRADFTLLDDALQKTGPVELTFRVNGHDLDAVRYETPGHKRFEKPVPPDWLTPETDATVAVSIDKLFTTPDGTKYGFILSRIGFTR